MDTSPNAPSPIAAAISYDPQEDEAPRVTAKGRGLIAAQIIDRASKAGVPLIESQTLANALVNVEVEQSIPPELYLAVAEVLAWLVRIDMQQKMIRTTK